MNKTVVLTVKEIAEELHVSDQTIRNIVKELFDPSKLLWRVVNGGNTLFLTYEQATAIKLKLRTRNNLKDNFVVSQIGNDLEFFALLKKREKEQKILDEYRDRRIAELQKESEIMKPKAEAYDSFLERGEFSNLRESAQLLGLKQNEFMRLLKSKYIYKNNVGQYRVYAEFADLFTLRPYKKPNGKNGLQLMINIKGLEYFRNQLNQTYLPPPSQKT